MEHGARDGKGQRRPAGVRVQPVSRTQRAGDRGPLTGAYRQEHRRAGASQGRSAPTPGAPYRHGNITWGYPTLRLTDSAEIWLDPPIPFGRYRPWTVGSEAVPF